jgi:hypothetical protein
MVTTVPRRNLTAKRADEPERRLSELGCLGQASRAELLHVLMLPVFDRAGAIRFTQVPVDRSRHTAPDSRS